MGNVLISTQPDAEARGGSRLPLDIHHLGLVLLFVLEILAFYAQLASRITPFYPPGYDQTAYMVEAYRLFDGFLARGWGALLGPFVRPQNANGVSFTVQGALLMLVGGPNRTALLSLNLIHLLALQLVLFWTVRARLGVAFAWIALGLLLSSATLLNYAGGFYDFRIDFAALCLYGIWVCLLLRSDAFRDLRVGLLAAAVGAWLVVLRFITVAYLGAVYGALLLAMLVAARWAAAPGERADFRRKARNLFVSGALTAAIAFPVLYAARRQLYDYYGIGHFLGEEKYIRAAELGITTMFEHLAFYPGNLLDQHLGRPTVWLMVGLLALCAAAGLLGERPPWRESLHRVGRHRFDLLACTLAVVVPLALLSVNIAKSPVVVGIAVAPIVLFVVTLCASIWPTGAQTGAVWRRGARLAAAGVMVMGLAVFLSRNAADPDPIPRLERERVVRLNEAVVRRAHDLGIASPRFSIDRVADYLNVGTLELYGYESLHRISNFSGHFGHGSHGIFATPRDEALSLLKGSDIVVLTDPSFGRDQPYPMNVSIKEYWAELWEWANGNLTLELTDTLFGVPHHVFMRPGFKLSGLVARWITRAGLRLEVDARALARRPFIVLEGPADPAHYHGTLGGLPQPRAEVVESPDRPGRELPATFALVGTNFRIVIDARVAAAASDSHRIALTFDRFFVPKLIGRGNDPRAFVIIGPTNWHLREQPPD